MSIVGQQTAVEVLDCFRTYLCARCRRQVHICPHCDRGQLCCSAECSSIRRGESIRAAQRRYQQTQTGARKHAARQSKYRSHQNKVTHQGSVKNRGAPPSLPSQKSSGITESANGIARFTLRYRPTICGVTTWHCHFCGRVGNSYLRFGFQRTKRTTKGVLQL